MKDMYPNTKHITSCDLSPLIFHNQTHLHNHIYKEHGKDWFFSAFSRRRVSLVNKFSATPGRLHGHTTPCIGRNRDAQRNKECIYQDRHTIWYLPGLIAWCL